MPELPEVETIRRDLETSLLGHAIIKADLRDSRLFSSSAFTHFQAKVLDQRWKALHRKGKYLLAELDSGWRIVFHLRMTGQLVLGTLPLPAKFRLSLEFNHGTSLSFYDQRRFGEVWLLSPGQAWHSDRIPGPDALSDLNLPMFLGILKGRSTSIHPLLLDQQRLAGVGNIYAQEALHKALIRPSRPAKRINEEEGTRLFHALQETLEAAIQHRGSTSRNYRDAFGQEGSAQTLHAVYRKGGRPCPRCAAPLKATRLGGRGAVYCSRCQR
jgi:formamidopyrimidine-DNA glycosylase